MPMRLFNLTLSFFSSRKQRSSVICSTRTGCSASNCFDADSQSADAEVVDARMSPMVAADKREDWRVQTKGERLRRLAATLD